MNISEPFIRRPIATALLSGALALLGIVTFPLLPIAPLPQVDFPTINVSAGLPGASPEVMAASIATPLEKQFTRIAGVTEMTSRSNVGSAQITLQFDLSRDINGAARDVQAAINAAAGYLPSNLPQKADFSPSPALPPPSAILQAQDRRATTHRSTSAPAAASGARPRRSSGEPGGCGLR